ncbi:MAG: 30S ribosomal protein S27e [Nanoarchaeota archaeon]|nr:30S ribosomal protein S27e [Nanoarchaeota archaeon]MBU4072435.1 30S ribosomal protein S27e [Candidatus Thermoplasmatota archaeon]
MRGKALLPTTKFLKVTCSKCKNEQIIFNKASLNVKCLVCGTILSESTGGKSKIKAKVLQVMA